MRYQNAWKFFMILLRGTQKIRMRDFVLHTEPQPERGDR